MIDTFKEQSCVGRCHSENSNCVSILRMSMELIPNGHSKHAERNGFLNRNGNKKYKTKKLYLHTSQHNDILQCREHRNTVALNNHNF